MIRQAFYRQQSHCGSRRESAYFTFSRSAVAGSARVAILWWLTLAVSVAASTVYIWHYLETKPAAGHGLIALSGLRLDHDAEQLHLQADARIRLPRTVQSGLDSGVPLTFVLNLIITQPQSYWLDKKIFYGQRHYTLTYYELTRHYRVTEKESEASRNFRSLTAALAGLGQLGRISFALDKTQVADMAQEGLEASLSMRLSKSALPLPLQPIIRSSWTLVSEEYRWPVT